MKRLLLFVLLAITATTVLNAQSILSDDCATIYDLGTAPACPDTIFFTNVGATTSDVYTDPNDELPDCWSEVEDDVWIQFDVPADGSLVDFTVTVIGIEDPAGNDGMVQPAIAVYRGECAFDGLAEIACAEAGENETTVEVDLQGLTPGLPYFLRIQDWSDGANNAGTFQICVDSLPPINFIDEGGSTSCSGELYDTGGPDGDYSVNENFIYTICPDQPHNCIIFTLDYYNIDLAGTDGIFFYDGSVAGGTQIAQITGGFEGGGVCYEVAASSGCLSIEFVSDGNGVFEGFAGSWQCTTSDCPPPANFTVDNGADAETIEDAVSAAETLVTLDTIICDSLAYGTFENAEDTELGLDKGLLLTSGQVANVNSPSTTFNSGFAGTPGDFDLNQLSPFPTNDACIVELDVFVNTDKLEFEYVFGSEEYPEFVNSSFNDIFAFLVSGPGIVGDPNINNQLNIAVLPDGNNTPVQINDVNFGMNWEYYRNNENGQSIVYDGLTSDYLAIKKSLTATVDVIPCNTYHLKLAIADRQDAAFDSGVFIAEIRGGAPSISLLSANGIDYMIEGCTGLNDSLLIELAEPSDDTVTYKIIFGGSAQLGLDYFTNLGSGSTLTFLPGETVKLFNIFPINDIFSEGTETIDIDLEFNFGCGDISIDALTINIEDEPVVNISTNIYGNADTAIVCEGGSILLKGTGTPLFTWEPASILNFDTIKAPTASPTTSTWVYLTGTFPSDVPSTCFDKDSIFLEVIDPQVDIEPLSPTNLCVGDTLILTGVNNVNNSGITWTPFFQNIATSGDTAWFLPTFSTQYSVSVALDGCNDNDFVQINVDQFNFPQITTTDTTLCQGQPLKLANDINFTSTTYLWTPPTYLVDPPTNSGPLTVPLEDIEYTLVATSLNGYCSETATVNVEVIPASINVAPDSLAFLCLGESILLEASSTTGEATWEPDDGTLSSTTGLSVSAFPEVTTKYIATMTIGACTVKDSVLVRVDSLPSDLSIYPIPDKKYFCPGDTIALVSDIFEPSSFPSIQHDWSLSEDQFAIVTPLDAYNILLFADGSFTYTRETTNNACSETTSYDLKIIQPIFNLSYYDTIICPGQTVQLLLNDTLLDPTDLIQWTPNETLTCDDCPDPFATPLEPTNYRVEGTLKGCFAENEVFVDFFEPVELTLDADPSLEVHQGSPVTVLANTDPDIGEAGDYTWFVQQQELANFEEKEYAVSSLIEDTNFKVILIDENGCVDEDSITVSIIEPQIEYPDIFTPNGDGTNDVFNVVTNGNPNFQVVRFEIFNRWGEKVFETDNLDIGWDGTFDGGKDAPADAYVLLLEIQYPIGTREVIQKDIMLLRQGEIH